MKYEYKIVPCNAFGYNGADFLAALNDYGKDGWRFVKELGSGALLFEREQQPQDAVDKIVNRLIESSNDAK